MAVVTKENFGISHFNDSPLVCHPQNTSILKMQTNSGRDRERDYHLIECIEKVDIEGEVIEMGVFTARSTNMIADCFKQQVIHGFDSFKGLPEDWAKTDDELRYPENIRRKVGKYALDKLPKCRKNLRLWVGMFADTLPQFKEELKPSAISFLHVDCDLYSSTATTFEELNDIIVPGTIICFDELAVFNDAFVYDTWDRHEYKALKEWTTKYDRQYEVIYHSNYQQASIRVVV